MNTEFLVLNARDILPSTNHEKKLKCYMKQNSQHNFDWKINQIEIFFSLKIDILNSNDASMSKGTNNQFKEPDFPGTISSDIDVGFFPEVVQNLNS